jgi:hypothetical protein
MGTVRPARLCMQRHVVRGCRYARCGWHASAAGVCSEASTAASTPLPRNRWTPQSQAKCQPTRRVARICRRRSPSPRKCHVTLPCRSRSAAVVVVLGTGHITATRSTQKAPTPGARSCYRMARDAHGSNSSRDSDTGSETGQRRDDYCTRTCASSWCQRTEVSTRTVNRVDCVAKWWLWQVRHIPQPVAAATVVLAAGTAIPAARRGNTEVTIGHAPAPVAGASVQRYQHMSSAEHRCPSRHGVADRARGCERRTQTTIVSMG